MSIDLDAIEAAARAATPGPWWISGIAKTAVMGADKRIPERNVASCAGFQDARASTFAQNEANARHIATMDPQTTLGLVERVRELEAIVREVRRRSERYEEWALSRPWAQNQAARMEGKA